jgi:hypothetical protein
MITQVTRAMGLYVKPKIESNHIFGDESQPPRFPLKPSPSRARAFCFWVFLAAWQLFCGVIRIFYFKIDAVTSQLVVIGLSHTLMFVAM